MANVLFKQGTQAKLDSIRATGGTDGAFYLTSDTHRLYIGLSDNSIVPVNEGVITVKELKNLPSTGNHAGEFYYVSDNNILCVYNGSQWVQINPDTNTTVSGFAYSVSTANGVATITSTVTDSDNSTVNDNFTITGAKGASVTSSGKAITITGEQYDLNSSVASGVATINLTSDSGTDNSSIKIAKGTHTTITKESNGDIKIDSDYNKLSSAAFANQTAGFQLTITDKDNDSTTATVDPVIKVGANTSATANQVHFVNGAATLPVYSKSDIDELMKNLQAMTFRGVANSNPASASGAKIHIGDTWKAGSNFELVSGTNVSSGDMIIATSSDETEQTDGTIAASKIVWQIIPSGDEGIVTYAGVATADTTNKAYGMSLQQTGGDIVSDLKIKQGNKISLGNSATSGNTQTITVNHASITAPTAASSNTTNNLPTLGTEQTITAITGLGFDGYGHVTSYQTSTYKTKDTNAAVDTVDVNVAGTTANGVTTSTITTTVKTKNSKGDVTPKSDQLELSSSSLTVASTAGTASTNAKIAIDMVWGTF